MRTELLKQLIDENRNLQIEYCKKARKCFLGCGRTRYIKKADDIRQRNLGLLEKYFKLKDQNNDTKKYRNL